MLSKESTAITSTGQIYLVARGMTKQAKSLRIFLLLCFHLGSYQKVPPLWVSPHHSRQSDQFFSCWVEPLRDELYQVPVCKHSRESLIGSEIRVCPWNLSQVRLPIGWPFSQTQLDLCLCISFGQKKGWIKSFLGGLVSLSLHSGFSLVTEDGLFRFHIPMDRNLN